MTASVNYGAGKNHNDSITPHHHAVYRRLATHEQKAAIKEGHSASRMTFIGLRTDPAIIPSHAVAAAVSFLALDANCVRFS